ncbi:hypothetical protein QYM36_008804 [Artemia franciscana]|uniref:Uncharacterized protein n=1 Tax=Artemia franciscana TaxID=6661 RepID=A0AA88HM71_ARTSF|nr:hypothetical protein QYM36_008804 [Artemia franciscana]
MLKLIDLESDLECTSSSDGESLLETSSSTQSHERQNIPACTSLGISTLLSESDSQEVDSNNDGIACNELGKKYLHLKERGIEEEATTFIYVITSVRF